MIKIGALRADILTAYDGLQYRVVHHFLTGMIIITINPGNPAIKLPTDYAD